MKTVFSFFAIIFFSSAALPQTAAEVTCRAQAKEVALQTYSSCITEARNSQVDEIRKSYQKDLADLKAKYDQELKKMAAPGKSGRPSGAALKSAPAPVPVKGVAKQLPGKTPVMTEAPSVQTVSEGTKVVTVENADAMSDLETEAAEADQVEVIDMPVE